MLLKGHFDMNDDSSYNINDKFDFYLAHKQQCKLII